MLKRFGNFFLILIVIFSCDSDEDSIASSSPVVPITKNNVLLIIVDDIGLDATIGYNIGSQKPNMPNLQNLISSGVKFNNVWSNPVCSPTRSTILTGKYGYRTSVLEAGDELSTSESSLHNYLTTTTNYISALVGKWHRSGTPADHYLQNNTVAVNYYGMRLWVCDTDSKWKC